MDELAKDFPKGLAYDIIYNPTEFVAQSIDEVYKTILEAMVLVVIVIIVFLQSWRMAIVPIVAIPVSLIGTLAVLFAFGFSLNMLTLFGLVLAIGIVVDDAIVVVENVERNIALGSVRYPATHLTMDEVGTAVIAISLVLIAVFVPTAFIPGITGQFYLQFAVTIAVSTAISAFISLTLSPALAALLFKPHHVAQQRPRFFLTRWGRALGNGFNRGFDALAHGYARAIRFLVGSWATLLVMLAVFAGLIYATVYMVQSVPRGFIPTLDQGYAIVVIQLPDGASLTRTDAVVQRVANIIEKTPGIDYSVAFTGLSGATFTNATNAGVVFARFSSFEERLAAGQSANQIIGTLFGSMQSIQEAFIIAMPPPPIRGVGNAGGFKMQLQERDSADMRPILGIAYEMMGKANQTPGLTGVFTTFSASSPQFFLEIDRDKARMLNVPIPNIFETLSINLGTSYVNDFNAFGRVYQVRAQADQALPPGARRHRQAQGPLGDRRAGAARHAGRDPRRDRPGAGAALQHVCVGAAAGQRRARRRRPARRSTRWRRSPTRRCRPARRSSGPSSPSRSATPATRPSSSSACRCCSCSSRSPRSMKAGSCRSRSC